MSNEENTEQQAEAQLEEASVNSQEEDSSSAEESSTFSAEPEKAPSSDILASILDVKEKNPKVFFGGIGGIVVLLLLIMGGNDDEKVLSGAVIKNLAIGQKYVLKSANSYDPAATVRLVAVPGAISAYDDTEEADRNTPCQHIPQGTPVSVVELQDAYGTKNAFVKVQMEEGECKGKDGWALAIDVQ